MRGKLGTTGLPGLKISDVVASGAVAYREFRPLPALSDVVLCTWERTVPRAEGAPAAQRVLPDGCVDLVWRGGGLWTAGPDTRAVMSPLMQGETVVGIRMRPGAAGALLGLPASEIRDDRVPVGLLWAAAGDELTERLADAAHPSRQRQLLERTLLRRRADAEPPDALVAQALALLGRSGTRVGDLSRELAISERQLLRRFRCAVGYGPKMADRVLRFQRFVQRVPDVDGLARVAADLGYSDQAHLTRECVELSGLPPTQLL
ncbi:MAG TPA: helix-turn-helix domain-containing protein [Thermoleophilaceae bacterium]|nr:helix-turn-helix domain-containing protein [Thermoleophilaceae bacterium]